MNRRFFGKKATGILAGVGAMLGVKQVAASPKPWGCEPWLANTANDGAMTINEARSARICGPYEYLYLGYDAECTGQHVPGIGSVYKMTHTLLNCFGEREFCHSYSLKLEVNPCDEQIGKIISVKQLQGLSMMFTQ